MATPIPALVAQIEVDADSNTLQSITPPGAAQTILDSRYYFGISNVGSSADGQSFLKNLRDKLDSSSSLTWVVVLTSEYKVKLTHSSVADADFTLDSGLATLLGFTATSITVPTGATGYTGTNRVPWMWTPDMPISDTGPTRFDPTTQYGWPESAGAGQWSPDQTAVFLRNGVQYRAQYRFNGLQGYYLVRPTSGYTYRDFETFWTTYVSKGRRLLMWRDRDNIVGSATPTEGTGSPYTYVEYYPTDEMRSRMLAVPVGDSPHLHYWDMTWDFWLTEHGETPYTD